MLAGRYTRTTAILAISFAVGSAQTNATFAAPRPDKPVRLVEQTRPSLLHRAQTAPTTPGVPAPAPSPSGGEPESEHSPNLGEYFDGAFSLQPKLSSITTNKVVRDLQALVGECLEYGDAYSVDCMRANLDLIAKSLPRNGAYGDVRDTLLQASRSLDQIVVQNLDTTVPELEKPADANPRFKKSQSYRAIKQDRLDAAMSQARDVINEATTQLLRSAENSASRLAHYQTIATAVGSTKVLLRSI